MNNKKYFLLMLLSSCVFAQQSENQSASVVKWPLTTESKKLNFTDKSTQRRNKLLAKLDEQILVAEAMLQGEEYFGTKIRIERDEDGEITRHKEPKRVNKWFYTNNGNDGVLKLNTVIGHYSWQKTKRQLLLAHWII